jgi:hypothetical protein
MIRRAIAPLLLFLILSRAASAQSPLGVLLVSASRSDGAPLTAAEITLLTPGGNEAAAGIAPARVGPGGTATLIAPPGAYVIQAGGPDLTTVTTAVMLNAAEVTEVQVRLARTGEPATSQAIETDRWPLAYQTQFDKRLLDALPHSRTAGSLLETAHPFLVGDRIDGGGLTTGTPQRLGGQGSSATQTSYRLDGVDVTDPDTTGQSLFFADLRALQSMTVTAASLDASSAGPAPTVDMALGRPGANWSGAAELTAAPGGMQAAAGDIVPIERLKSWIDGGFSAGGSIASTSRLFLAARAASVDRYERESPDTLHGSARAFTARWTAPGDGQAVNLLGAFNTVTSPLAARARFADRDLTQSDDSLLLHASWDRARGNAQWSFGGAFQRAALDADLGTAEPGGVMERLKDGPPLSLLGAASTTRQRWSLSARMTRGDRRWLGVEHLIDTGASIGGAGTDATAGAEPAFGELVNGVPARVWDVSSAGQESQRSSTTLGAFVTDRMALGNAVTLTAALRLDVDHGSADRAADRITWTTLLPRAHLRWRPREGGAFSLTSGYGWYAHRLPLGYLAVGDPAAASGTMYRWDDRNGDRAWTSTELTPVAAVGFCCAGGDPSRIDDGLRRPVTREFRIGGEHTIAHWRIGITGLDRREDNLVTVVNTGVAAADYTVSYVDDPGVDIAGLQGSAPLPIYNRRPESALHDRYLLTNTSALPSRFQSFDIVLENEFSNRWFVRFGGTAYRSEGVGASRGYRSDENDQGLLGEAFSTPNAQTYARGRLFYDRAFIMKVMGGYTARVLSGAFVARYQDGQPFARLVLADGLTQGRDMVQAYGRGGQRFTYTVTLDARVAADWRFGDGRRAAGVVFEAFNLLNMANEVEEDIVTGPAFRAITAVQPPRVLHAGIRVTF